MSAVRRFVLPDLGEGLTEAEIVSWLVAAGDEVALNQALVEVETEKAVVELPSPFAGTVIEVLADAGETVAVGSPLIAIDTDEVVGAGDEIPMLVGYGPTDAPPSRRRRRRAHPARSPAEPRRGGSRPLAAPPVRFMARQNGVDLADVTGHGPDGIITREDLAAHLAGAASLVQTTGSGPERESRTPVRGVQKHMAAAMVQSVATAPQACVFLTVDATETVELVERLRGNRHFEGVHVTVLALVARAMVLALRDHPALNSSWDDSTGEVVTKHYVNLGVAVASPLGLLVPTVKDAHEMSLRELATALAELAGRARATRCTPADLSGGTITVTNVGVFGVDGGVPILNPGEAAILAVGTVQRRPWEFEGEVALSDAVVLTLSFDHRLVDGRAASLFLREVGDVLTDPVNLIALG